MQYWTDQSKARYSGGVRLLSTSSQLQAQSLVILDSGGAVEAEGDVLHLVQGVGNASGQKPSTQDKSQGKMIDTRSGPNNQVTIHSSRLQYARSENRIRYTGDVFLVSATSKIWADSMDVFLDQAGVKVEQANAHGRLRVIVSDKEVKGTDGEYLPAAGRLMVTGSPVEINDYARKSRSTALRLTFFTADGRIVQENR
jgi:lipopolysaccharide export system protein LptA